jgi:hypothetical protein
MLTLSALIVLSALVLTIAHADGRVPLWPAVLLLVLLHLLALLPIPLR